MKDLAFENTVQKILKKLLLVVIGSGLITNTLYIYGLAYYEGYIESLGFEYNLFPVKWEETLIWAYFASREIGASTVSFWAKITGPVILLIFVVIYFVARMWMSISDHDPRRNRRRNKSTFVARILVRVRGRYPKAFGVAYPPVRWFLVMEQSVWAFFASYFALIALLFVPLFIFIWVYFPLIGLRHGEGIGIKRFELYQEELCGGERDYWNKCLTMSTEHLKDKGLPNTVYGRILAKNGTLIGLITEEGPVIMTMPPLFYQNTIKNECYKSECESSSQVHNKSMQPTAEASAD